MRVVKGVGVDGQTRCAHYHSPLDVVAIKMACCRTYYACKDCHDELAGHALEVWSREAWDEAAVLCGVCMRELTIGDYVESDARCPNCGAGFNPNCRKHHHFYFAR